MIKKAMALLLAMAVIAGGMCSGIAEIGALNIGGLIDSAVENLESELPHLGYDPNGETYPLTGTDGETRTHTVMLYLCGSDLEEGGNGGLGGAATKDLKEIVASGYNDNQISVLVMAGGAQKWFNNAVDAEDTAIYEIVANSLVKRESKGKMNMGSADTLSYFINYCYEKYPAKNYSLILWDHGGGPLSSLMLDMASGGKFETVLKARDALDQTPINENKLYLLGFDACLEGSVEIAKVFAPYAKQLVASEESEPNYGWNYLFLKGLEADEAPTQTGERIIDTYFQQYPKMTSNKITLSSINLAKMDEMQQKSSAFFSELNSLLHSDNFREFAALRQDLESVDMANKTRDLVDLKELVEKLSVYAPEQGQDLLNAIDEMISAEYHTSKGVSNGLSIFFPYYEAKGYSKKLNQSYKDLEYDPVYTEFIDNFNRIQRDSPQLDWNTGSKSGTVRDTRTVLSVMLTSEQAANVAEYSLAILWLCNGDTENPVYVVVNPQEEGTELDGVQLTGYYVHHALCIISDDEAQSYPCPLVWTRDAVGHYLVPAVLKAGETATEVQLVCDADSNTGEMTVISILVKDEIDGYYTYRDALDLSAYDTIVFTMPVYKPTRDSNGAYIGVFDWDVAEEEEYQISYELSLQGDWTLAIAEDSIPDDQLYAAFVLTDYYRQTHTAELIPIVPRSPGPNDYLTFVLTYDDDYLTLHNIVSENNGDLYVLVTAENPAVISMDERTFENEHEIFVHFSDVEINGEPVDTELWIEGNGAFGGIPVGEQGTDTLILPGIELDSVQTISLTITVVDAETDAEIAVIPASGYLYIPNN